MSARVERCDGFLSGFRFWTDSDYEREVCGRIFAYKGRRVVVQAVLFDAAGAHAQWKQDGERKQERLDVFFREAYRISVEKENKKKKPVVLSDGLFYSATAESLR